MKEQLDRMNRHVHAGHVLIEQTLEAAAARPPRRRSAAWKLIPALAALLALLVATPALAASVPAFNDMVYRLFPEVAMRFRPVNRSATDQGLTVSVLAVDMEDRSAVMYLAVQGEGVNETTMIDDDYHFRDVQCVHRICTPQRYNPETNTAVFRILYSQGHGALTDGEKAVFTLNRILTRRSTRIEKVPGFTVSDAPVETISAQGRFIEGIATEPGEIVDTVLKPGSLDIPLAEGVRLTAAGVVEDRYHVQIRREGEDLFEDFQITLMSPSMEAYRDAEPVQIGTRLQDEDISPWVYTDRFYPGSDEFWFHYGAYYDAYTTFRGEDGAVYTDYVFSKPVKRLMDYVLYFQLTETVEAVDGNWTVTFPMEDYQQPET